MRVAVLSLVSAVAHAGPAPGSDVPTQDAAFFQVRAGASALHDSCHDEGCPNTVLTTALSMTVGARITPDLAIGVEATDFTAPSDLSDHLLFLGPTITYSLSPRFWFAAGAGVGVSISRGKDAAISALDLNAGVVLVSSREHALSLSVEVVPFLPSTLIDAGMMLGYRFR